MTSPDASTWRALQPGRHIIEDEPHELVVVECGDLVMPSGRLVAADPFVNLRRQNRYFPVPTGSYPVRVTIDETIEREMYVSLILAATTESERHPLIPFMPDDEHYPASADEYFSGIAVDAGTVCFVDDEAVRRYMPPDEATWLEELFDNSSADSWFHLMDDPAHIRDGLANIPLPHATDGANIIISHSGWGDGFYPVIGGYDAQGALAAIHIDLRIFPNS